MIKLPAKYALEVETLEMALIEARKKGISRQLIDEICRKI